MFEISQWSRITIFWSGTHFSTPLCLLIIFCMWLTRCQHCIFYCCLSNVSATFFSIHGSNSLLVMCLLFSYVCDLLFGILSTIVFFLCAYYWHLFTTVFFHMWLTHYWHPTIVFCMAHLLFILSPIVFFVCGSLTIYTYLLHFHYMQSIF